MWLRVGLVAGTIAVLAPAGTAMAGSPSTRFAEPGGNGPEPCAQSDPCDIQVAVEDAPPGSPVILATGTYSLGSDELQIADGVDVTGVGYPDETVLQTTASIGVHIVFSSPGTFLQSLTIDHDPSAMTPTFGLQVENGTAEFVRVDSTGDYACFTTGLIRSALCLNSDPNFGIGAGLFSPVAATGKLRNVTAVALGTTGGYGVFASATGAGNFAVTLDGRNVIAQGATVDQRGFNSNTSATSHIDLDYSNFDTLDFLPVTGASGTGAGASNNQTDPPALDAGYHQMPGSPTIDAGNGGVTDHPVLDFDLDSRNQNGTPDIGADESDGVIPSTEITKNPPKRTKRRRAAFEFESDEDGVGFDCKIDGKPFKPCNSGAIKYKRLARKKHTFQVRADDGFNVDATPDTYTWRIRKKK
jgi:hypothetical protein